MICPKDPSVQGAQEPDADAANPQERLAMELMGVHGVECGYLGLRSGIEVYVEVYRITYGHLGLIV